MLHPPDDDAVGLIELGEVIPVDGLVPEDAADAENFPGRSSGLSLASCRTLRLVVWVRRQQRLA